MRLIKMQGLGNDYLYVYGEVPENAPELSRKLSDRHFGFGSDGMIYITPSKRADFGMRIFNADGSEAKMCGNGIRCVGKYVFDKGYTDKTVVTVETLAGIKTLTLSVLDGAVETVTVDMGVAVVSPALDAGGQKVVPVDLGNPHAVSFTDTVPDDTGLKEKGSFLEKNPLFPGGVNAEFVTVLSPAALRMRVWERGSGITLACGTGACASVAAAVANGYCPAGKPVKVTVDGGDLTVTVAGDGSVTMTGPAAFVYEGETLC
ncbi:MAG: diaminopimelate epimerase [Clostridia bacterium]|nr:diaminopimelate epimerase [Clostridia bacterium]